MAGGNPGGKGELRVKINLRPCFALMAVTYEGLDPVTCGNKERAAPGSALNVNGDKVSVDQPTPT